MSEHCYVACDLGAESGRVILGRLREGRIELEEIHRFPNGAVKIAGSLRWDILRIFDEVKTGLRKVAARGLPVQSLSVDSWGLDYVLTGAGQPMLSLPYTYRDARNDGPYAAALKSPGAEPIFAETGIQFMPINTLYQLIAERENSPQLLGVADRFLMIADYLHFLFCGVPSAEESLASTTQLYNPVTRRWSERLAEIFALPPHIFPPLVAPGTRLGPLLPEVATEIGLPDVQVIATCSHDTGAAVAAVPASGDDWAYLSSGTWSLIGVELTRPLLDESALAHNFTNEAGFGGTTRFLKNIVGLWLLQECRRSWARTGQNIEYGALATHAGDAEPFRSLINPNDPRFLKPDEMPERIAAYCRETGQPAPETIGQFTRCIYESLALLYRRTLDEIESVTGRRIARLHIVGGGSQSALLNQFAANATGRTVMAGPIEATAVGNVLIQANALGHLHSLSELRRTVAASFAICEHLPNSEGHWQTAFDRFLQLI
ncbi:MAG: rhamnulokinase family protein [Chthoniobacteraceae bacterium]